MNLLNEHTFLIISFAVAILGVYKFAIKRVEAKLKEEIENIKSTITDVQNSKQLHEMRINALQSMINETSTEQARAETDARNKAQKQVIKDNEKIEEIIDNKRVKYERELRQLELTLLATKHEKYIDAVIDETEQGLSKLRTNRSFQETTVLTSLEMLENISEK